MSKELYLTSENRQTKVNGYLASVHPNGRSRGSEFAISDAALLVLDMQRYFLDPESHAHVPSAAAIVEPIEQLIACFRTNDRPVIATRHIDSDQTDSTMDRWWKDTIRESEERSQLAISSEKATILHKSTYDAFYGTELDRMLNEPGVKQLVICGVLTHLCVETTARSAFCHGYHVFLQADATATITEEHHKASLLNLSHGFARVTMVDELLSSQA